ncbi:hypothetical protein X777_02362, partial [Ooceraea biroi]
ASRAESEPRQRAVNASCERERERGGGEKEGEKEARVEAKERTKGSPRRGCIGMERDENTSALHEGATSDPGRPPNVENSYVASPMAVPARCSASDNDGDGEAADVPRTEREARASPA